MTHAFSARQVPGACQVVLVKAWYLTDTHVIRLGREQGIYETPKWPSTGRTRPGSIEVRGTWHEVLDVYRDRDDLEAVFGQFQPACVQPGCHARLREGGWHVPAGTATTDTHEHQPATRPGQLNDELAKLADQVWEESESSILIRVCIHELSDPGQIEDLFVILNRNDLIEAQSLPAACRETAWDTGLADQFTPAMLDRLIRSAGGILLTRGQLRQWAGLGRDLTGDELAQLDDCIASSSIPDAIGTIVFEALKLRGAGQEDGAGTGARSSS